MNSCPLPRQDASDPQNAPGGGTFVSEDFSSRQWVAATLVSVIAELAGLPLPRRSHPGKNPCRTGESTTPRHLVFACESRLQQDAQYLKGESTGRLWERCGIRDLLWIAEEKLVKSLANDLRGSLVWCARRCPERTPIPLQCVVFSNWRCALNKLLLYSRKLALCFQNCCSCKFPNWCRRHRTCIATGFSPW